MLGSDEIGDEGGGSPRSVRLDVSVIRRGARSGDDCCRQGVGISGRIVQIGAGAVLVQPVANVGQVDSSNDSRTWIRTATENSRSPNCPNACNRISIASTPIPTVSSTKKNCKPRLLVATARILGPKVQKKPVPELTHDLDKKDLNYLRRIVKAAWSRQFPDKPPFQDHECDTIINHMGMEVVQEQLRAMPRSV